MSDKESSNFDPTSDNLEDADPWSDDVLKQLVKMHKNVGKSKRQKLARDWFRSELFYNGIQWITFDTKLRRWREVALNKATPRPVTNTYASYCDIFSTLLASIPIEISYRPLNSASNISQTKMKVANDLSDAIKQKVKLNEKQREAAPLISRQGEVFLIPYMAAGGTVSAPKKEVAKTPEEALTNLVGKSYGGQLAPSTTIESPETPEQEALPPENLETAEEEQAEHLPGMPELKLDVASAFECYMDEDADSLEDSAFFVHEKSFDVGVLKGMFPDKAEDIKPSSTISGDISKFFAGSLKRLTSGEFGSSGYFIQNGQNNSTRANYLRYWHDPCPNYPKGIYLIMVNDVIVHRDHLPYQENGKYYKNIVHIRAKRRAENIHGRSPMDDAIPKQTQRNKLESFIELCIYRMAAPHWLIPKDCGVNGFSGEPGTKIEYSRVSASQTSIMKPEMISGAPIQPVVLQFLGKIDEDTEYILGITKALMGQLPPGTPAARALELLMQRSRERHGDVFFEWNGGWASCINMLVKIVRQVKPIDLFTATKKTYGGFSLRVFEEGDYDLNLDIVPETEQPSPARSTAGELELLQDFVTAGVFQMPPPQQYEIFKRFNLTYLNKNLESDKEYVAREQYYLLNENQVPIVKTFDNHPLHYEDHRMFIQTEEYQEWAKAHPQQAQEFEQHVMAHQYTMAQLQAPQGQPQATPQLQAGQPAMM